jgi:hypothetical protein
MYGESTGVNVVLPPPWGHVTAGTGERIKNEASEIVSEE